MQYTKYTMLYIFFGGIGLLYIFCCIYLIPRAEGARKNLGFWSSKSTKILDFQKSEYIQFVYIFWRNPTFVYILLYIFSEQI